MSAFQVRDALRVSVSNIECVPELNGDYLLAGSFRKGRSQWMIPGSRRYVRYIRERWEIYISHHPNGTKKSLYFSHNNFEKYFSGSTYFYTTDENLSNQDEPPLTGWIPTDLAPPHDRPILEFAPKPDHCAGIESVVESVADARPRPYRLWCNDTCPYVQRVRIAIVELGVRHLVEEAFVDVTGDKAPEFLERWARACPASSHRRAAVPLLEVDVRMRVGVV